MLKGYKVGYMDYDEILYDFDDDYVIYIDWMDCCTLCCRR